MLYKFAKASIVGHHHHCGAKTKTAGTNRLGSFEYEPRNDGHQYLYVAVRACTADEPNLNNDMLPHDELKDAYKTFIGSYVYLNHDNMDPAKARGAIIDAKYHDEDPDDRWIEILEEIDEERCPKLCAYIRSGEIDTVSMGCQIQSSTCSICGNVAEYPWEYCDHIAHKGQMFGNKLAYEICNGIEFFECSWVYDPADRTAVVQEIESEMNKTASFVKAASVKTAANVTYDISVNEGKFVPGCPPSWDEYWGGDPGWDAYIEDGYVFVTFKVDGRTLAECTLSSESIDDIDFESIYGSMYRAAESAAENVVEEIEYAIDDGDVLMTYEYFADIMKAHFDDYDIYPEVIVGKKDDDMDDSDVEMDNFVDAPRYPDEITQLEDERCCPLCGSNGFDGEMCDVCGYTAPPEGFDDIILETEEDYNRFDEEEKGEDEPGYRHAFVTVY